MQMSRWDNAYNEFQTAWKQVKESALSVQIEKGMDGEQRSEIARFKRVIEYVDNVQKSGAKDVIPRTTIEQATTKSEKLLGHIDYYNDSLDLEDLTAVNDILDELLSLICPFVTNSKDSAQAVGHAFRKYSKVIDESTQELKTSSEELVNTFEGWHTDIKAKHKDIIDKNNEIDAAHDLIIVDDEDGVSIQTQVNNFYREILVLYKELLKGVIDEENEENNQPSIKAEIEKAKGLILNELAMVVEKTEELKVFYGAVFGAIIEEGEREGEREGGLKQEMDDRKVELIDYTRRQREIIRKLKIKINNLLPGATSAGLASAFMDLKLESKKSAKRYTLFFGLSLLLLFVIAGVSIIPEICYAYPNILEICKEAPDGSWLSWVRGVLAKALFILPALWFAIFTSKRRSEHQRLEQEYAHKESVSKSFEGYKTQIKELEKELEDEKLLPELLKTAIKAIDYNASTTLGGKHGDNPPIAEAGKIVGAIKNILKSSN